MKKIVITQLLDVSDQDIKRLEALGDVKNHETMPNDYDDWLDRVKDADIICTGKFGFKQKWQELADVFVSVPFVGVSWFDPEKAKQRNVTLASSPGCNKEAVSEWIIGMMINLFRGIPQRINAQEVESESTKSLAGKTVCICGVGHIGARVAEVCDALNMNIIHFKRGDDLLQQVKEADVVVDTLSVNEESRGIYDTEFFRSLKQGSYFITVTSHELWDIDAMIMALDQGILAGVANDCGGIQVDDTRAPIYQKLSNHPKVLATAHTAYNTDRRNEVCNDMMVANIESWLAGNPINVVQ